MFANLPIRWRVGVLALILMLMAVTLQLALAAPAVEQSPVPNPEGAEIPAAPPSSPVEPAAPQTNPLTMTIGEFDRWTVGGGQLWWTLDCVGSPPESAHTGYLDATAAHGPGWPYYSYPILYNNCQRYESLVADNYAVYYYAPSAQRIMLRPLTSLITAAVVYTPTAAPDPVIGLKVDAAYIYWAAGTHIRRAPKDGSGLGAGIVATATSPAIALVVHDDNVYWLDSGGLWRADKSCQALPCAAKVNLSVTTGQYLLYQPYSVDFLKQAYVYWSAGNKIYYWSCNPISGLCSTNTFYTAPAANKIGQLGSDGVSLFWVENYEDCTILCGPGSYGVLQRRPLSGATAPVPIAEYISNYGEVLFTDASFVYFYNRPYTGTTNSVLRLPVDATALLHYFTASQWEVVQAIQSPSNDVKLVANKPTFVRAYGTQTTGTAAINTEAILYGTRNGSPLPGSPLQPINGGRSLQTGVIYSRTNLNDGWLFQLPEDWTAPGAISLKFEIDPRHLYVDPDLANNSRSGSFTFNAKAPVCIVTVPVRTNGPFAEHSGASFDLATEMVKRLWPVPDIWVYPQSEPVEELEVCWWGPFPYPCYGPYEPADDGWKILLALHTRDSLSDDPDRCDNQNARTHYIGLIHPDLDTGSLNGQGYMSTAQAMVKLPPLGSDPKDWTTIRAATLSHEMTHNYDRNHINCGGAGSPDPGYPYPGCALDNPSPNAHFGFDIANRAVITEGQAADYMSYSASRWVSDYTWGKMFNNINTPPAQAQSVAQPNLFLAGSVVMVSGGITPTTNQGELHYAWVVPTATLSTRVMDKWQAMAVPAVTTSMLQPNLPLTPTYHLRLYDNNGSLLDDRQITLDATQPDAQAAEPVTVESFMATFPAPAGTVARLDLLADSTLLARLQPGLSAPNVNVVKPIGGETFTDHMTIQWNASDANNDPLLFQVQYSPNGGLAWLPVASEVPALPNTPLVTLTLNSLSSFPGSAPGQGRIRVIASDGYHTAIATSAGFTVTNHKPEPYIVSPSPNLVEQPGSVIMLNGDANDAEDGGLSGASLQWKIYGVGVGTGELVAVAGYAPGTYTVTLTAQDSLSQTETVTTTMTIGTLVIPQGNAPTMDGYCDDAPYANAVQLQISPYAGNSHATVRLIRSSTDLWACFNGMNVKSGTSPYGVAGLGVDVDNSGGRYAQSTDYRFWVREDGTPAADHGNGAGAYVEGGPAGWQAMLSGDGTHWNAELRIPASALGGWKHLVRLNVFHRDATFVGDHNRWPYAAAYNSPSTWAVALLGDWNKVYLPLVLR